METLRLELGRGAHPADGRGWVYAWVVGGRLAHVGATWMHPAARAELHLHQTTDDPRSLTLRERVAAGERTTILAFPLAADADRAAHRTALVAAARACGWLPSAPPPEQEPLPLEVDPVWLAEAVAAITLELVPSPTMAGAPTGAETNREGTA